MPFAIRPLKAEDIPQSVQIEREAFPSMLPPTSFRRELENRLASYLVAWTRDEAAKTGVNMANNGDASNELSVRSLAGRLLVNARNFWDHRDSDPQISQDFIVGFVGTWYMADQAHIVSVSVRNEHRGHGIGELLLVGAIEQAMARRAEAVTLEVRPSNQIATNLYRKYGFQECGVRKGYYSDDREDAIIMTTDPIGLSSYRELFRELQQTHGRRWGFSERVLF